MSMIANPTAPARDVNAPLTPTVPGRFAALDFETADYGRDSACALSIVIVENDTVVDTWTRLIRPPRSGFVFTYLHGIAWPQVKDQPSFGELWQEAAQKLEGVDFVAAHNASFDRSVLRACCDLYGLAHIGLPFVCTVKLARKAWALKPAALPNVCAHLRIPLKHHDAESDSHACALILLSALSQGHAYDDIFKQNRLKPV